MHIITRASYKCKPFIARPSIRPQALNFTSFYRIGAVANREIDSNKPDFEYR